MYLPTNATTLPGLTLVMMSHAADRLAALLSSLRRYRASPPGLLEEIVVVWNDPSRRDIAEKIEDLNAESVGVTLRVVAAQVASANNRFAIWESIRTEGVIIQDDDLWLSDADLDRLISTWRQHPEALVGARASQVRLEVNGSGSFLQGCQRPTGESECTMLPRPWVVATHYLQRYMEAEAMHELMDKHPSCDEIYFNGILANATGAPPIAVEVSVQTSTKRSGELLLSSVVDSDWVRSRAACRERVEALFPREPASGALRLAERSAARSLRGRLPMLLLISAIGGLLMLHSS